MSFSYKFYWAKLREGFIIVSAGSSPINDYLTLSDRDLYMYTGRGLYMREPT